ncbi:type I polyketide synthase [Actinocrispum wychmicini]|nr:type I polyketide synthase [Actinocrispum wychmicini]
MRPDALRSWLADRVRERADLGSADVDIDLPLAGLGISSVLAAELAADLSALTGTEVHPAVLFQYPTIRTLADALGGEVSSKRRPAPPPPGGDAMAIIGMSARVPGADSVAELWTLLREGHDPVGEVPSRRWQLDPESLTDAERGVRFAGLLADIESFDAEFFRVPYAEAVRMDPQQRLLLQGAWEALEDGGQVPADLAGTRTGVYVGISNNDYVRRQLGSPQHVHGLTPTGNALSVAANRLSYMFDLRGPSLAVDTACSSSLVAVHLAMRDLRAGMCELAIVAGVNLLVEPDASLALARAGMLAPDGRCKPFDAAANGYVRSEGCVVAVLKPLDRALADGDRVYAVVLGSDVTQDGRTNGLTAPNPAAQEDVLRRAYADARIEPSAVQYVECHGTGTLLGDPIEARALGTVVGAGRPAHQPCLIGSVKSTLGHLESAAGLAGLVKLALSLHHGSIPGTLHFRSGNPHIDFAGLGLEVVADAHDWPAGDRLAAVSSFGFGGTNAHVVLSGAPTGARRVATGQSHHGPYVLPVSARHPESLVAAAHGLADRLAGTDVRDLPAVASALSLRRTHHQWRHAVVGSNVDELVAQLREIETNRPATSQPDRRLVFAFPGQSEHSPEALLALADTMPLVAATLRRCSEIIEDEAGWNLLDVLAQPDADEVLRADTTQAQPATVATQLALAAAWRSLGLRPDGVIGHSLGEVSAAAAAGALSLDQALRVSLVRGRVIKTVTGTGRMLAMAIGPRNAEDIVTAAAGRIAVATVNGPASVVLAGDSTTLEQVRARAETDGILARWVPVDYPSHSPWMSGAAADLTAALADLEPATPVIPFWSSATGGAFTGLLDAAYWGDNLRRPVRFADAAGDMLRAGPVTVVELGTHPVLRTPLAQLAAAAGRPDLAFVATMDRGVEPSRSFRAGLARLYELGVDPQWDQVVGPSDYVPVPTYPWRRKRYWLPRPATRTSGGRGGHPLLGRRLDLPAPSGRRSDRWELELTGEPPSIVAGHVVAGQAVLPGAGYLEMALAAGRQLGIKGPIEIRDARFSAFLPLSDGSGTVQTIAEPNRDNGFTVTIMSKQDDGDWTVNATATVAPAEVVPTTVPDPATARATCFHPLSPSLFYETLRAVGLDYGTGYQLLNDIWSGAGMAVATLAAAPDPEQSCVVDPRSLDGALQLLAAASRVAPDTRPVLLGVRRLVVDANWPTSGEVSAVARLDDTGAAIFVGQQAVLTVDGIAVAAATPPVADAHSHELHCYDIVWRQQENDQTQARELDGSAWVLAGAGDVSDDLAARLRAAGATVRTLDRHNTDLARTFADVHHSGAVDVVYVAGVAAVPDVRETTEEITELAALIKAASFADVEVRGLWVVTAGCQDVGGATQPVRPGPAALWGLVRALPFENATLRAYCVDLDASPTENSMTGLLAELRAPSTETEIALRDGRRYVARFVTAPALDGGDADPGIEPVQPGASYLITGGYGAIGLRVAHWLAALGAAHIGLVGRTPPGEQARETLAELERDGPKIHLFLGDIADPGTAESAAAELRRFAPIKGVAHAAGILADGPLLDMPAAAIESVVRPKVGGALCLDVATAKDDLDWIVHFSSAASVLGSPGQANYCAANAFLDAYGVTQRTSGRRAIVVNWGAWAGPGLAQGVSDGPLLGAYSTLDPDQGIEALSAIVRAGRPRTVVLATDLRHLVRLFPGVVGVARFSELTSADDAVLYGFGLGSQPSSRPTLKQSYIAPRNELERRIVGIWQRSLGFDRIGVHDGFFELGGDSVFANQMVLEVNRTLGVGITAADAFARLTVAYLAELAEQDMLKRLESLTEEEAERLLRSDDR